MKKKYCKLCEPDPDFIDEDSIEAVGYYIKKVRKIPVCEMCLKGQKQYYPTGYYDESKNEKPVKETCKHGREHYEKKNLVTQRDHRGDHDILKCNICGNERKRYGLG